jgi:hypothetical protein
VLSEAGFNPAKAGWPHLHGLFILGRRIEMMKITERVRALSERDFDFLQGIIQDKIWLKHFNDWLVYLTPSMTRRVRPVYNAILKFERETSAEITYDVLADMRKDQYSNTTTVFVAVMDNKPEWGGIYAKEMYPLIGVPYEGGYDGFKACVAGLSIKYHKFYYSHQFWHIDF